MFKRSAKDIELRPISHAAADAIIRRIHYSGTIVRGSQIHIGAFLDGKLEGALQFGPSLAKAKMLGLVDGTGWNQFIELNRMAFSEALPRNSESRAIGIALRMIRKRYPHLKWIVSYADATRCGDGAIYRASGFVLTMIKRNTELRQLPDGSIVHAVSQKTGKKRLELYARTGGRSRCEGVPVPGFQLRYIYFLDRSWRSRLKGPELSFKAIEEAGAGMARGEKLQALEA